jgi:hypothetical protein
MKRQIFPILFAALLALSQAGPASAAQPRICFGEVPDCIEGRFAEYWRQHGGLPVFGFPLNTAREELVEGKRYLVQLFERNRFELHPENGRPYDVLLGRLGDERLRQQGRDWQTLPKAAGAPGEGCFFSQATGHATCGEFFSYFRAHGLEFDGRRGFSEAESIALFGLPISKAQQEIGGDGKTYLTQWFERARLEYHPENRDPYRVLLGRLGAEVYGVEPGGDCAGIPDSSPNATITPRCFKGGTLVTLRAAGFRAGEQVTYAIGAPSGVDIPPFLASGAVTADGKGAVELKNTLPAGLPKGIYSITFAGKASGNKGIIYFKIVG